MEVIGVVCCPLNLISFYGESDIGRTLGSRHIEELARSFIKAGCKPSNPAHHIDGIVTADEARTILSKLDTTIEGLLSATANHQYPFIQDHQLACLHGRRRVAAAIHSNTTTWWAVKLHCVKGSWTKFPYTISFESTETRDLIRQQAELSLNELKYSDGDNYRGIIQSIEEDDKEREVSFRSRLSRPKEISLNGLLNNAYLNIRFKTLLRFPGLIDGLQLGNIHKHLALHSDEQVAHYLDHIDHFWTNLTGDFENINKAVDIETVECLQMRAPSVSLSDRSEITRMMNSGILFKSISDPELRRTLEERLLSYQGIIPSIRAFHENMKYLSLGVKALWQLVVPGKDKRRRNDVSTLSNALLHDWSCPGSVRVQDSIDTLVVVTSPVRSKARLAFQQILLQALREFADLSFEAPRQDCRRERVRANPRPVSVRRLCKLASVLGFENSKIRHTLASYEDGPPSPRCSKLPDRLPAWRGGKPFTRTYKALQQVGFLPRLNSINSTQLSPEFVLQNFLHAFFGSEAIEVDWATRRTLDGVPLLRNLPEIRNDNRSDNEDVLMMGQALSAQSARNYHYKNRRTGRIWPRRSPGQSTLPNAESQKSHESESMLRGATMPPRRRIGIGRSATASPSPIIPPIRGMRSKRGRNADEEFYDERMPKRRKYDGPIALRGAQTQEETSSRVASPQSHDGVPTFGPRNRNRNNQLVRTQARTLQTTPSTPHSVGFSVTSSQGPAYSDASDWDFATTRRNLPADDLGEADNDSDTAPEARQNSSKRLRTIDEQEEEREQRL